MWALLTSRDLMPCSPMRYSWTWLYHLKLDLGYGRWPGAARVGEDARFSVSNSEVTKWEGGPWCRSWMWMLIPRYLDVGISAVRQCFHDRHTFVLSDKTIPSSTGLWARLTPAAKKSRFQCFYNSSCCEVAYQCCKNCLCRFMMLSTICENISCFLSCVEVAYSLRP
jgi:hypothetical protein